MKCPFYEKEVEIQTKETQFHMTAEPINYTIKNKNIFSA
jgi:hypothetical protein